MTCDIFELFAKRHSFYDINSSLPISVDDIHKIARTALELYPSPFNSQSARVVLLFNDYHFDFWKIVEQILLKNAPTEKASAIQNKISSFAHGAGTILFYVDTAIIQQQEQDFPLYASHFRNWGYQCNAILQFMVWSALANVKIGASLQHYNPIIDNDVKSAFGIPDTWELIAQMPFGGIEKTPPPHLVENLDEKLLIFK